VGWLIAVFLRPFGALLLFGVVAALALLLRPLIRSLLPGRWVAVLYDRSLRKRHPCAFATGFFVLFYGTILLVAWGIGAI
jgi:hypothetical protein